MTGIKQRGLSSKARRARLRRRAARLHHQQLIDEFFEPEPEGPPPHPVRIGRRSEFLPSAAFVETGLESDAPAAHEQHRASTTRAEARDARPSAALPPPLRPPVSVPTERPPRPPDIPEVAEETTPFSFVRFAYGCAVGSGAAALLLMGVKWMLG